MIRSFRKFFEFAGRQSRNWYLGLFYEIIRCILEALQFAALLVVLDGLVRDNITAQTALLAFGIMLVSVIGTAIFWYLAHGKEGEGSYRMCEDKRIQIGNRMKYMPMGYFNSHSLGNLTSVSTATMSDLESMSFAIIVRTLVGVIHASIFSVAMCYFSWKISLIFLAGVILFMVINTMLLRCSKRLSPIRLDAQTEFMDAVLEYIQGMSVVRAFHMAKQSNTTLEKSIDETKRKNQLIERQRIPYIAAEQVVLRIASAAAAFCSIALFINGTLELTYCLIILVSAFMVYSQLESAGEMFFMNPLNFLIGGYKLSAREFQWSSRTPKRQKKPILRSITCTSGLASGLLLPFPWSRAQSLCLPSGILSGIFSRPVCCGFWPMCCLHRTTNRKC